MTTTNKRYVSQVDEYASLKAKISLLEERAKKIVESLKSKGDNIYAGTEHDLVISSAVRTGTDWKQLCEDLKISQKVLEKYATSSSYQVAKLVGKKTR